MLPLPLWLRYVMQPSRAARTGTSRSAMMSTPRWRRPPPRGASHESVYQWGALVSRGKTTGRTAVPVSSTSDQPLGWAEAGEA